MNELFFLMVFCNLCNASVQFVIKHDKKDQFRFTALQGDYTKIHLRKFNIDLTGLESVLLLEGERLYTKSSAALRIAKHLSGGWPLLYGFIIIPKLMRDWVYDCVAKNRYKWWGRQESCWIPTPELKSKFLA